MFGITDLNARVVRIDIQTVESPTFAGRSFGDVGQYEKLVGEITGELDPSLPEHAAITDIELAPRNDRGFVEYATDLLILRPIDPDRGNGKVFFEINNRGRLLSLGRMNDAQTGSLDHHDAEDAGNGFLMRQGYTFVSSGWDATASAGEGRLTIRLPIAIQKSGASIIGPSLEEFVIDDTTTLERTVSYPAATTETSQAQLTVRARYEDSPVAVPAEKWEFVGRRTIRLRPEGTPFQQGRLYELVYSATDPMVAGIGFAAVRDVAVFLRSREPNGSHPVNPLLGRVNHVYSFAVSQPARFMRDFVHLGFNRDTEGVIAFDGVLNWIGGASGGFFNYRFAQPHRTQRQHIGRWFPERQFPFAYNVSFDPVTERRDGRLQKCLASATCPKIFDVNSSNEYWVKASSLLTTDTMGQDLSDPAHVRHYLFSSFPHSGGRRQLGKGICQQPRNPVSAGPGLRALLVALDEWVSHDREPPESQIPRREDGTLVPALPQEDLGFPNIPGVHYEGLMSTGDLLEFGEDSENGILTRLPPRISAPYPAFVPKTDADGHDIAGIRFPEIEVPRATHTGWATRGLAYAGNDLCDASGQRIEFPRTKAERLKTNDPRLSIAERYPTDEDYMRRLTNAARDLRNQRFLLEEDVMSITVAARDRLQ